MHTYIHTYIHTYVYTYIHIRTATTWNLSTLYIHIYICIDIHVYICIDIHVYDFWSDATTATCVYRMFDSIV